MKENKLRKILTEPFGGLRTETLEAVVSKYSAEIIKYTLKNQWNEKLAGLTPEEIVEKFKNK